MTPPSLLISKIGSDIVGCRFLNRKHSNFSIDHFWIGNGKVFCCWFLNQKRNNFWLLIFESAETHLLVADLWIDNCAVLAVDFWIGSDTVKPNKESVLDRPTLGENGNRNQPKDNSKGDKDNLDPTSKHPFAFKRGINAARRKEEALCSKQAACSCLLPLPKKSTCTSCIPSCMHHLWMLKKNGAQGKDRSGRNHGRRRSLDPFPITDQQLWLQQPPSPRRRPTYTSYMSHTLTIWRRRELGSYVDDWNHERRGSVTDPLYNKDGREGKTEIEERTMSPKPALKL